MCSVGAEIPRQLQMVVSTRRLPLLRIHSSVWKDTRLRSRSRLPDDNRGTQHTVPRVHTPTSGDAGSVPRNKFHRGVPTVLQAREASSVRVETQRHAHVSQVSLSGRHSQTPQRRGRDGVRSGDGRYGKETQALTVDRVIDARQWYTSKSDMCFTYCKIQVEESLHPTGWNDVCLQGQ